MAPLHAVIRSNATIRSITVASITVSSHYGVLRNLAAKKTEEWRMRPRDHLFHLGHLRATRTAETPLEESRRTGHMLAAIRTIRANEPELSAPVLTRQPPLSQDAGAPRGCAPAMLRLGFRPLAAGRQALTATTGRARGDGH